MISKVLSYPNNRLGDYGTGQACTAYDREEATGKILQHILRRTGAIHAELDLLERGSIACDDPGNVPAQSVDDWYAHDTLAPYAAHRHSASKARETLPLSYGGKPIGTLSLSFAEPPSRDRFEELASCAAREAALSLTRHELACRARHKLNLELLLAGHSRAQYGLEAEIEKVSTVRYPVLLHAAFGSSPTRIAAAIHLAGSRAEASFVTLDCAYREAQSFAEELEEAFLRAVGGTIFLSDADMLDQAAQRHLLRMVRQARAIRANHEAPRFIVSMQHSLDVIAEQGNFCRMLRSELDYLRIRIPPLHERREDIVPLFEEWFRRCSPDGVVRGFSGEAREACFSYDWPENESEAERVAARLAVMSDELLIGIEELRQVVSWLPQPADTFADQAFMPMSPPLPHTSRSVDSIDPDLFDADELDTDDLDASGVEAGVLYAGALEVERGARRVEQSAALVVSAQLAGNSVEADRAYQAVQASAMHVEEAAAEVNVRHVADLGDLPRKLADGDYSDLHAYEIGVQRALRYVGNHYTEEISLGRLARESYISPSHLSFLLKRSLGVPFKSLLAAIRIERAQKLLTLAEHSITEISLEVGFGDLSHFERTFKRLVGTNPRQYRRRLLDCHIPTARHDRFAASDMSQT
jgi:DNA-binding NtrC family response regulator/AraC-like DNA-binding protein